MPEPIISATLRLPATVDAPARARHELTSACRGLSGSLVADAALLTSELVANSVRHGTGPVVVVIEGDGSRLSVTVADTSPALPVVRRPSYDDDGGRGLQLVDAIARCWGCNRTSGGAGKAVWFELAD